MTKEEYQKERAELVAKQPKIKFGEKPTDAQKELAKALNEKIKCLVDGYITTNKPCPINSMAKITLSSGRVVRGTVIEFGILQDGNVHPTAYSVKNKTMYVTIPIKEIIVYGSKDS